MFGKEKRDDLEFGRRAEDAASDYLRALGMKILDRNFKASMGELDIVAAGKAGLLVVAEVKARADGRSAKLSLTPAKQAKVMKALRHYLGSKGLKPASLRFDFLVVTPGDGGDLKVEHFPNAFQFH